MPRRRCTAALSSLLAVASVRAFAQTHHVAPPEKVTRAVAVFEWTGDLGKPTASRLVPVSLFIGGHFEDAGLYLARPVPFALEPGDIYSVELAGDEKGTLTVEHARDFTTGRLLADVDPVGAWYGFGRFSPLVAAKLPALRPAAHLPVIASSGDSSRPHLSTKTPDSVPASTDPSKSGDTTTPAKTPMGDDPDRPTLGRRTSEPDSSSDKNSSAASDTPAKDTDPERPSLRKRSPENTGKKSPPQSGVTGPDRSLNDDPDRPIIRHGKAPAEQEAEELKGTPAAMHQVAAVSDAARHDSHVFSREWESPAERADVLSHLQQLAREQAAAYLAQNRLTPGVPVVPAPNAQGTPAPDSTVPDKAAPALRRTPGGVNTSTKPAGALVAPAPKKPAVTTKPGPKARSAKAAKPAPPAPLLLTAEQLTGYTLSYGGLPTFVYTAEVPVTTGGPAYITVVAQRLPSGELQIALRSITDATHLDRTPWMRLIDAVDPDWSHRASLLFELRAQSSRQFALYRLISAQAEQQFVSAPIR